MTAVTHEEPARVNELLDPLICTLQPHAVDDSRILRQILVRRKLAERVGYTDIQFFCFEKITPVASPPQTLCPNYHCLHRGASEVKFG